MAGQSCYDALLTRHPVGRSWMPCLAAEAMRTQVIMLLSRINSGKSDGTTIDIPSERGSLNSVAHTKSPTALASRRQAYNVLRANTLGASKAAKRVA